LLRAALVSAAIAAAVNFAGAGAAGAAPPQSGPPDFGPNVVVFDPSMPTSQIQAKVDAIAAQQVDNEFGAQRYALLFKPGTYNVLFDVGFYTHVAGLGQNPDDVLINGGVNVPATGCRT
jgi:hypothetical protein